MKEANTMSQILSPARGSNASSKLIRCVKIAVKTPIIHRGATGNGFKISPVIIAQKTENKCQQSFDRPSGEGVNHKRIPIPKVMVREKSLDWVRLCFLLYGVLGLSTVIVNTKALVL